MKQTKNDPVIDEIRQERHRISEECGHDPQRLVAYYRKLQEQYQDRLIQAGKATTKTGQPFA